MSTRGPDDEHGLVCPGCGSRFPSTERFCPDCGLPLVLSGAGHEERPVSERHARARMIKPQLAEGEPVRVARASNEAEGQFIQSLLMEEGVPSMLRRSAGFDVPDMLAAGPRDVMVPRSGAETAREVLLQARIIEPAQAARTVSPGRLLAALLIAVAVGLAVIWLASGLH